MDRESKPVKVSCLSTGANVKALMTCGVDMSLPIARTAHRRRLGTRPTSIESRGTKVEGRCKLRTFRRRECAMITQRASAREGAVDSSSEPMNVTSSSLFLERWMAMEVSSAQALVRPRIEPGLETMANVDQKPVHRWMAVLRH